MSVYIYTCLTIVFLLGCNPTGLLSHSFSTLQVYLVDYGLAYRFSPDGVHKEYKEDPKRCHDGTIELTSIDAHKGACV